MEARRVTPSRRSGAPRSHLATIRCVKRRLKWWIGAKSVKLCKRRAHLSSSFSGGGMVMAGWTPDPTFYPSARMAMEAPPETLGYVAILNAAGDRPDAVGVVDLDPTSSTYSRIVGHVRSEEHTSELQSLMRISYA